jgi:hypothetical protein
LCLLPCTQAVVLGNSRYSLMPGMKTIQESVHIPVVISPVTAIPVTRCKATFRTSAERNSHVGATGSSATTHPTHPTFSPSPNCHSLNRPTSHDSIRHKCTAIMGSHPFLLAPSSPPFSSSLVTSIKPAASPFLIGFYSYRLPLVYSFYDSRVRLRPLARHLQTQTRRAWVH